MVQFVIGKYIFMMEGTNSMATNRSIVKTPVQDNSLVTEIAQQAAQTCEYEDDYAIPCDAESPTAIQVSGNMVRTPDALK